MVLQRQGNGGHVTKVTKSRSKAIGGCSAVPVVGNANLQPRDVKTNGLRLGRIMGSST
jgi:hypothetical protein